MIARIWHGETRPGQADAYVDYLGETGVRGLRATSGNLGAMVLRRVEAERADFLVFSFWQELADVRAFAGDDLERARYYPDDRQYLLHFERNVRHYETPIAHLPAVERETRSGAGLARGRHLDSPVRTG